MDKLEGLWASYESFTKDDIAKMIPELHEAADRLCRAKQGQVLIDPPPCVKCLKQAWRMLTITAEEIVAD